MSSGRRLGGNAWFGSSWRQSSGRCQKPSKPSIRPSSLHRIVDLSNICLFMSSCTLSHTTQLEVTGHSRALVLAPLSATRNLAPMRHPIIPKACAIPWNAGVGIAWSLQKLFPKNGDTHVCGNKENLTRALLNEKTFTTWSPLTQLWDGWPSWRRTNVCKATPKRQHRNTTTIFPPGSWEYWRASVCCMLQAAIVDTPDSAIHCVGTCPIDFGNVQCPQGFSSLILTFRYFQPLHTHKPLSRATSWKVMTKHEALRTPLRT